LTIVALERADSILDSLISGSHSDSQVCGTPESIV
jgi:hypothetical protein